MEGKRRVLSPTERGVEAEQAKTDVLIYISYYSWHLIVLIITVI